MADKRVELIISLLGYDAAMRSLGDFKRAAEQLNGYKIQPQIELRHIERQIADVKKRIRDLTSMKTTLEFKNTGIREISNELKLVGDQIKARQHEITQLRHSGLGNLVAPRISELTSQIDVLKTKLLDLTQRKHALEIGDENIVRVRAALEKAVEDYKNLIERKGALNLELGDLKLAEQYVRQLIKELGGVENAATKAGNALSAIGNAFSKVAQVFQNISGLTNSNVLDTIERYATVMTTRMFTQDWSAATTRFDILNTYSEYLQMVGVSAEEASASLDKINAGIQGVPVGLSDVAYQVRMYQMYLDDLDRSTNLAVGLERALVAGGANEQMRSTARYEIDRLLSAGELSTSRQYRALMQGLGVSSRFLREEMGYGDLTNAEFINQLFKKQISGDELIRGLESLASSEKLNAAIETYRTTIESGLSNIRFALTRGKANILSELNSTLDTATGKNISGWLYEIRDAINDVYKSIAKYIADNPQMIRGAVDTILMGLEKLKSFDWARLFSELGSSIGKFIDVLGKLYDMTPKGLLTDLIVFSATWAGPIANAFSTLASVIITFGAALKGLGSIQGFMGSAATGSLLGTLSQLGPVVSAAATALAAYGAVMLATQKNIERIRAESGIEELSKEIDRLHLRIESIDSDMPDLGFDKMEAELSKAESIANRIRILQDTAFSDSELKELSTYTDMWNDMFPDWTLTIDPNTRALDAQSVALLEGAKSYAKYSKAVEYRQKVGEQLKDLEKDVIDSQRARLEVEQKLAEEERTIAEIRERGKERMKESAAMGYGDVPEIDLQSEMELNEHYKERARLLEELSAAEAKEGATEANYAAARDALRNNLDAIIAEWEEKNPVIAEKIKGTRDEIKGLVASYEELRDAAEKAIAKQVEGFEKLKEEKTVGIGTTKKNLDSQTAALKDYNDSMATILGWWQQNKRALGELGDEYAGIMASLASGGLENAGFARGLAEAIEGKNFKDVTALLESYRDKMAEEAAAVDMTAVAQAIAQNYAEALELELSDFEGFDSVFEKLMGGKEGEDGSTFVDGLLQPLQDVKELLGSEDGIVGAAASVEQQFTKLSTETLPQLQEAVQTVVTQSESAITTSVGTTEPLVITAINNIIQALTRLKNKFTETANHAVSEFQKIINKTKEVVDALQEIMNKLVELTSQTWEVHVNIITHGEVPESPGGGGGGDAKGKATGGLIDGPGPAKYYAKGGSVFDRIFKPQGTDTVPAMLTPGEYVLRKKAVDQLGVPFLQRLNRLDIAGAFDSLMSRVYKPSVAAMTSYSNTYNSSDNRAYNVNVNNYQSREDFTYRVASRFAHAL